MGLLRAGLALTHVEPLCSPVLPAAFLFRSSGFENITLLCIEPHGGWEMCWVQGLSLWVRAETARRQQEEAHSPLVTAFPHLAEAFSSCIVFLHTPGVAGLYLT